MTSLPNGAEYPIESFKWGLPVSKFDVSSIPMTDDIYIFTGHFADFEQFEIDSRFDAFGQVKADPTCSFLLIVGRSQLLYWLWARQKIQEPRIVGSCTSHLQWFNQPEWRTGFPSSQIDFKGSVFYFFL